MLPLHETRGKVQMTKCLRAKTPPFILCAARSDAAQMTPACTWWPCVGMPRFLCPDKPPKEGHICTVL